MQTAEWDDTPVHVDSEVAMRIALVSCVKAKLSVPAPARELYTSPLFRGLRRYAMDQADAWFILSAEYGLLHPDQVVAPYERTLIGMPSIDRRRWEERVLAQLLPALPSAAEVLILAGKPYRDYLEPVLREHGCLVSIPMEGLAIGKQLQFLKRCQDSIANAQ